MKILGTTRRLALLAGLSAAAVTALPAAGHAAAGATVQVSGITILYTAGTGETNRVSVFSGSGKMTVTDVVPLRAIGPTCRQENPKRVACDLNGITHLSAALGDGDDTISVTARLSGRINAGAGNDAYFAGKGPNPTSITYSGGAGADFVVYGSTAVKASLNGLADDGRPSEGDKDNILTDVEHLTGSSKDDVLIGSSAGNRIEGGLGADELHGLAGADTLLAKDSVTTRDLVIDCGDNVDTASVDAIDVPTSACETVTK
ncbi:hypothetical protein [Nonomuraea sp. SYSU D8015]|uniref:hypothetical protein n=1 Tax=Nonomuraea sp. SYSU D8015 TaxID=2593644 RepID=UPI001660F637|nr:hypothetical protein [Nonomuraea sp. SYSU D8015]